VIRAEALARRAATVGPEFEAHDPAAALWESTTQVENHGADILWAALAVAGAAGLGALVGLWWRKRRKRRAQQKRANLGAYALGAR
jgi:hypothetical protein